MIGWQFSKYRGKQKGLTPFDTLLEIFQQLMIYSSGDVAESLTWLTEIDKQHKITTPEYGISDFIEELKEKGYIRDSGQGGQGGDFTPTSKLEIALRKSALDEIFDQLKKSKRGDHITNFTGQGQEFTSDIKPFQYGDRLDNIAISESLKNAQINHGIDDFRLTENDLQIRETFYKSLTSTVLMLSLIHI